MNEYECEPIRGLPELPPEHETIIWQGEPNLHGMARRVFHVRKVGFYFAIVLAASLAAKWSAGAGTESLIATASWQLTLAAGALALLYLLAWLYTRTTVYTITNQRLVMRFGVALPMMINIPWSKIEEVDLRAFADGSGDIALTVSKDRRMSYWMLWPQLKSWQFSPVTPMLRSIDDASEVAAKLAGTLREKYPQYAKKPLPSLDADAAEPDLPTRARAAAAP